MLSAQDVLTLDDCLYTSCASYLRHPSFSASYYLQISPHLISFYSISTMTIVSRLVSARLTCLILPLISTPALSLHLPDNSNLCLRHYSLSIPLSSQTTCDTITAGHLVHLSFCHAFTFTSFSPLLLTNPALGTALAVGEGKKGSHQWHRGDRPFKPLRLCGVSKRDARRR